MEVTQFTQADEKLTIRYLLGGLRGEKKTLFEERYFEDEAFFEYVYAVEDVLIDNFLQKRLSWWQRRRFRKVYWSSPEHIKRVVDAQQMLQAFAPEHRISFWRSLIELVRLQTRRTQMVVAFVAVAVAIGPWVIFGIFLSQGRPGSKNPEPQRIVEIVQPNAEVRGMTGRLSLMPQPHVETGRPNATSPALVSFLLEPGAIRGEAEGSHRLVIPPTADLVRVELALPDGSLAEQYRVRLLIAGGTEVWRENFVAAHKTATGFNVIVWLPGEFLTHTDYVFVLESKDSAGRFSEIGSYQFPLVRK